jgi:hypothetical protein
MTSAHDTIMSSSCDKKCSDDSVCVCGGGGGIFRGTGKIGSSMGEGQAGKEKGNVIGSERDRDSRKEKRKGRGWGRRRGGDRGRGWEG